MKQQNQPENVLLNTNIWQNKKRFPFQPIIQFGHPDWLSGKGMELFIDQDLRKFLLGKPIHVATGFWVSYVVKLVSLSSGFVISTRTVCGCVHNSNEFFSCKSSIKQNMAIKSETLATLHELQRIHQTIALTSTRTTIVHKNNFYMKLS